MILVTGAKGQLGTDVCNILKSKNTQYTPVDIDTLDLTDKNAVDAFLKKNSIDAVIHCAAYTAVDKAQDDFERCFNVNSYATKYLAENCKKKDIKIVYISTDYVFSGKGNLPFETDGEISPLNIYGKSKFMGEEAVRQLCNKHFIVRTSWVFGEKNTNFIHTMLNLSKTNEYVKVVCDQIGSPTYSFHLAKLICEMVETQKYGTYHATNEGFCSWFEFCQKAYSLANIKTKVIPVTTDEYKTKATRPLNSRLSKRSLTQNGFSLLPSWEKGLEEYLKNIKMI